MQAIKVSNLSKSFGEVNALNAVSFDINENELFGFIGSDGAGKTTLFRILTTLLLPDSGSVIVAGLDAIQDFKKLRRKLGYMPGRFSLYQDLTVEENLRFFASIFKTTIDENYHLVKDIYSQIEPFKKRRAGKLSGGMKQKLALSCALIHKPEILILDEPTTGVDAVSRKEFWDMLKHLKNEGITIVVSTPYMDEAGLCDRVALIQEGHLLNIDTPAKIVESFSYPLYSVNSSDKYGLLSALREYENCHSVYPFGENLHYIDKNENIDIENIISYLNSQGIQDAKINQIPADIEDVFMDLMLKKADER